MWATENTLVKLIIEFNDSFKGIQSHLELTAVYNISKIKRTKLAIQTSELGEFMASAY